jgi:hypothetical protein
MLRIFIAGCLVCLLSTTEAFAEPKLSGEGKITSLNIPADGSYVRIYFSKPVVDPADCKGGDFYMLEFGSIEPAAASRFLSALMAAYLSNKTVNFWVNGCTQNVHWGAKRAQIYDIYM